MRIDKANASAVQMDSASHTKRGKRKAKQFRKHSNAGNQVAQVAHNVLKNMGANANARPDDMEAMEGNRRPGKKRRGRKNHANTLDGQNQNSKRARRMRRRAARAAANQSAVPSFTANANAQPTQVSNTRPWKPANTSAQQTSYANAASHFANAASHSSSSANSASYSGSSANAASQSGNGSGYADMTQTVNIGDFWTNQGYSVQTIAHPGDGRPIQVYKQTNPVKPTSSSHSLASVSKADFDAASKSEKLGLYNAWESQVWNPSGPHAESRDLRVTDWGYKGSGTRLTSFHNFLTNKTTPGPTPR